MILDDLKIGFHAKLAPHRCDCSASYQSPIYDSKQNYVNYPSLVVCDLVPIDLSIYAEEIVGPKYCNTKIAI